MVVGVQFGTMEYEHVGQRCAVPACGQRDFLPFTCVGCGERFCLEHRTADSHACTALNSRALDDDRGAAGAASSSLGPRCSLCCSSYGQGGSVLSQMALMACAGCGLHLCITHRDKADHACSTAQPPPRSHAPPPASGAAAQPRLRALELRLIGPANTKQRELAAKVALMRVKGRSVVDPAVLAADRFFLEVLYWDVSSAEGGAGALAAYLCVSRTATLGRVLDAAATALKVANRNHETIDNCQRLSLFRVVQAAAGGDGGGDTDAAAQWIRLPTERSVAAVEAEGGLVSGGTVVLRRGG